ncbi:MAG: nucleotide pyrophosphohydrolase [Anaerolineae bacterium]|nr:nucleotide pyrophosphohydrolase [Anaerolineae bacterium]
MGFQRRCSAFLTRHGLGHAPQIHALDLVSEVGEVAKALLEGCEYGEQALQPTAALEEELGDAFFSLVALAESLDVDLETALDKALSKYETRIAERGNAGSRDIPATTTYLEAEHGHKEHTNTDEG